MKQVVLLFVLSALIVLTFSGCLSAPATPAASVAPTVDVSAIRTETARDVLAQLTANAPTATPTLAASPTTTVTEVKPTETLSPTPAIALSPTDTPELKKTSSPIPTKARPAAPITTKSPPVAATHAPIAAGADGKFYAGYASCIGGTDVVHFLSENGPGQIMETYKIERYSYTSMKQCKKSFEAKVDALKQVHVCVLSLPEPAHADLAAVRNSTILALADLIKIREADFADRLCEEDKLVLWDDARVAFENAQKHLRYAQTMLDKYRSEQNK